MRFTPFLLFLSLIISCSKTSEKSALTDVDNLSSLTKEVISMNTVAEMKEGLHLLSTNEKQSLWEAKYKIILKRDEAKLTVEQKNIINKLYDFIRKTPIKTLQKEPSIGENFLKDNIRYFEANFSKEQLFLLIECPYISNDFSITNATQILNKLPIGESSLSADCTCRYSLSCVGWDNKCIDGGCNQVSKCGIAGTSSCTGRCNGINPE